MDCQRCNQGFFRKYFYDSRKTECTCGKQASSSSVILSKSPQSFKCHTTEMQFLTKDHWQFCKDCQLKFENTVKNESLCFSCIEKKQIFELPTCHHKFCISCINSRRKINVLCLNCQKFFRSTDKGTDYCYFCLDNLKTHKRSQISCIKHAYCTTCESFFQRNPPFCSNELKICMCYRNFFEINRKSKKRIESTPPYKNEIDLSDQALIYESYTDLRPEEKTMYSTLPTNRNRFSCISCGNMSKLTSICQNTDHLYCGNCFSMLNTARVLECQHCNQQLHHIQKPKQSYYETVNAFTNNKSISENKLQIPQLPFSRPSTNPLFLSFVGYSSLCDVCRQTESIKSFCCNHSYCLECLMALCCRQIMFFWNELEKNQAIFLQQFKYSCECNCKKTIRIPTAMIINKLKELTASNYKTHNFKEFQARKQMFDYVISRLTIEWASYFEGLKSFTAY